MKTCVQRLVSLGAMILLAGALLAQGQGTSSARRSPSAGLPVPAAAAMKSIDAGRIREHVRFLSHDFLEGRGTGQRGGDLAAEYIATQFALYGLKPLGDGSSFLQKVPLVGITTQPETTFAIVGERGEIKPKFADEYVAYDETQQPSSDVDAEIVFVGYGIDAPEYKWNDYKDVDVRGKVLLMFVNEPTEDPKLFTGKALTYYGRWTYKFEEAARKGAAGVLLMHKFGLDPYGWDVVRNSNTGEKSYLKASGQKLKVAARIQEPVVRKMLEGTGKNLDDFLRQANSQQFQPVPLGLRLKARMASKLRPFEASNVVGMIPGSDAKLKDEAVIYTAHHDHLGMRAGQPGDNIYNGAIDNGTGCGIVLELARAFSSSAQKPRRSIIFATVTAEEQGLLGSQYLGENTPIPANKIALNLNYDAVPALGIPEETEVVGSERTSFYRTVQQTARQFGLTIVPDAHPDAGHYYRSDHFSMARVGVPAFSIDAGLKYKGHPREWGESKIRRVPRQGLPPAQRPISSGDGFCRQRSDGAVRLRPGLEGSRRAENAGVETRRRVRGRAQRQRRRQRPAVRMQTAECEIRGHNCSRSSAFSASSAVKGPFRRATSSSDDQRNHWKPDCPVIRSASIGPPNS
jgi:Zn-dependent M28 family amino/carboxypeptidase